MNYKKLEELTPGSYRVQCGVFRIFPIDRYNCLARLSTNIYESPAVELPVSMVEQRIKVGEAKDGKQFWSQTVWMLNNLGRAMNWDYLKIINEQELKDLLNRGGLQTDFLGRWAVIEIEEKKFFKGGNERSFNVFSAIHPYGFVQEPFNPDAKKDDINMGSAKEETPTSSFRKNDLPMLKQPKQAFLEPIDEDDVPF